jgi:hypothetical protein
MTDVRMQSAGNDPASLEPVQQAITAITSDTGVVTSASGLESDVNLAKPTVNQRVPMNSLTDYLTRYTEIAAFTFTDVSPAQFADGFASLEPWRLFLTNPYIASKISNYMLIRGTMELLIIPAFPANGYGAYAVAAYPYGHQSTVTNVSLVPNVSTCMQVDHCAMIDVANCENVTLSLPFVWPYDYAQISEISVAATQPWGVSCWCLSPVRTAIPGGVTSGSIRVYARLGADYEMSVPSLQGRKGSKAAGFKPSMDMTGAADKVAGGKFKGVVSGIADKVSGLASMASMIPVIGPYAGAVSMVADTVGDVASWFGFTREDAPPVPSAVMQKPFSNPANIDGEDTADVAALSMGNAISIDPALVGITSSEDCAAFTSLFARWTLIRNFTWASTATTSTILGTIPISPYACRGSMAVSSQTVELMPAGYCGLPFQYWRGDMEYLIVIPVSKLHRGTLQVYWVPAGTVTTATPTVSTLNTLYDVSADERKQFNVGFARDVPYLPRIPITPDVAIIPTGATNGRLILMVVNPLRSQNSTAPVDVLIFARAGGNMDFACPDCILPFYTNPGGLVLTDLNENSITYQGADGDEEEEETEVIDLVPSSGAYPGKDMFFGEEVKSARTMMQKFTWLFGTTPVIGSYLAPHFPTVPGGPSQLCYDTHYLRMFTGAAAGTRYKFVPVTVGPYLGSAAVRHRTVLGTFPLANNQIMPVQSGLSGGFEFRLPYYFPKKYLETRVAGEELRDTVIVSAPDGTTVQGRIARALAPDIRLACFFSVPRLVITLASPGGDWWPAT